METPVNALNWFEIPVADFERARAFYSAIYDYDMPVTEVNGEQLGFMPCQMDKGVGGAIIEEPSACSKKGIVIYLNGGNDLNYILEKIESSGGSIELPKTHLSDEIGYIAYFIDSEGNRLGLHSPK